MPDRPRIVIAVPRPLAASETFLANHVSMVRALGFAPVLLVGSTQAPASPMHLAEGTEVHHVPPAPAGRAAQVSFIIRNLAKAGADAPSLLKTLIPGLNARVSLDSIRWAAALRAIRPFALVHAHYLFTAEILGGLRRRGFLRQPLIGTAHGYDLNVWPRIQPPSVFPGSLPWVDRLTFGSTFMQSRFAATGIRGPQPVLLPWGVDPQRFQPAVAGPAQDRPVTFLSVGRLEPVKGQRVALRAFALHTANHPGSRLLIAGDGADREALIALARELGIADRVDFLGALTEDELTALYPQADVFLFPSVASPDGAEEGQGIALLEAQAAGLPVIASDSGGIKENLIGEVSGFLIQQNDAQALAARMDRLAGDRRLRETMGQAGRAFVLNHRSLAATAADLRNLYAELGVQSASEK